MLRPTAAVLLLCTSAVLVALWRPLAGSRDGRRLQLQSGDAGSRANLRAAIMSALRSSAADNESFAPFLWDHQAPIGARINTTIAQDCAWTDFQPPNRTVNASVCLRPGVDLLGEAVRSKHYWAECADLPAMLHHARGRSHSGEGLFVDVGANIGMCTIHMLVATNATVVAFEPGADNLFFMSRSLVRLAEADGLPTARRRLMLVTSALGDSNSEQLLHQAIGNAGHAVIGQKLARYAPRGHEQPQHITIRRMDALLWPTAVTDEDVSSAARAPRIDLLKLDVEGYECVALRGMERLLGARAIRQMKVEVFPSLLRLQGCSAERLQRLLADHGFALYLAPPDSAAIPGDPATLPEVRPDSLAAAHEPYNLWCVLRGAPTDSGPQSVSPPPAAMHGEGHGERRRRRSLNTRLQRTVRRLTERAARVAVE